MQEHRDPARLRVFLVGETSCVLAKGEYSIYGQKAGCNLPPKLHAIAKALSTLRCVAGAAG